MSYVVVGKVGSSFGIHGWLKILTYTEFGADILDYRPWYLGDEHTGWQVFEVTAGKVQSNTVLAKIAGIDSPEAAKLLTGKLISIKREQLPNLKPNEFYWDDLKGLTVFNKEGVELGKVIYLMETGSNDVLVVKGEKEHAIPYLPNKVILKIDLEKGTIIVDWEMI